VPIESFYRATRLKSKSLHGLHMNASLKSNFVLVASREGVEQSISDSVADFTI